MARPVSGDRRNIHAGLPPDANFQDASRLYGGPQLDSPDGELETPCPCRTDAPETGTDEGPPSHPIGLIGLGFGSTVFIALAAFAVWQTHATRDSARP